VKLLAMKGLPSDSEDNFLAYFAEAAMEQQRLYGIPASVTLAQMALRMASLKTTPLILKVPKQRR
jgi:hypothetical protein